MPHAVGRTAALSTGSLSPGAAMSSATVPSKSKYVMGVSLGCVFAFQICSWLTITSYTKSACPFAVICTVPELCIVFGPSYSVRRVSPGLGSDFARMRGAIGDTNIKIANARRSEAATQRQTVFTEIAGLLFIGIPPSELLQSLTLNLTKGLYHVHPSAGNRQMYVFSLFLNENLSFGGFSQKSGLDRRNDRCYNEPR